MVQIVVRIVKCNEIIDVFLIDLCFQVMNSNRFTCIPFYVIKIILETDVHATATQICDSVLSWLAKNKVPPFEGFHLILETVRIHNLTMQVCFKDFMKNVI